MKNLEAQIAVKLPVDVYQKLKKYADKKEKTISMVVRDLIYKLLKA